MIAALAAVGASHVLAWALPVWVVASEPGWPGGAGVAGPVLGVALLAWLAGVLGGGSLLAGWLVRGRPGLRRGLLALWAGLFAALVLASLVAVAAAALPAARPPLAGVAVGVQLAVLLPGAGRARWLARAGSPVAVDLASGLLGRGDVEVAGGLAAAPAWLALALLLVAVGERLAPRPPKSRRDAPNASR